MKSIFKFAAAAFTAAILLVSCSGGDSGTGGGGGSLSTACNIKSASLEYNLNPNLGSTVTATINGSIIYFTIPQESTATDHVLTFSNGSGSKLYADGREIISGETHFNIENVSKFKSVAPAGNSIEYDVLVKRGIHYLDLQVYNFMKTFSIPGVSISVSKDEKLVYSSGYGYADVTTKQKVTSKTLFRLASMSKSQTAIAIMTLVEQGKISLSDKMFGKGGLLEYLGTDNLISGATAVTVQNCLEHASGWSYNNDIDPFFTDNAKYKDKSAEERIKLIITTEKMSSVPGSKYSYNNANYAALGLVIEQVSDMKYEEYMKKYVWTPAGVSDIHVGGSTISELRENETHYYSQNSSTGYGNDFKVIYALGGLIACTDELMQLMAAVDYGTNVPDILKESTLNEMYTQSTAYTRYAKGWRVNSPSYPTWASYHTGNLAGTATMWARGKNGVSCVMVCNSRSYITASGGDIDDYIFDILCEFNSHSW